LVALRAEGLILTNPSTGKSPAVRASCFAALQHNGDIEGRQAVIKRQMVQCTKESSAANSEAAPCPSSVSRHHASIAP
jgi:hypothetical protein